MVHGFLIPNQQSAINNQQFSPESLLLNRRSSAKLLLFRFLVRKYVTKFYPDNGILDRAELLDDRQMKH